MIHPEVGDVVLIDYQKGMRLSPQYDGLYKSNIGTGRGKILSTKRQSCRVEPLDVNVKEKIIVESYKNDLRVSKEAFIEIISKCENHGKTVYHDRLEKWVCPWCDL